MSQQIESATQLEQAFIHIEQTRMQGIPILNPRLKVEVVGFQAWENDSLCVLITPWFMNLMAFPGSDDVWNDLKVGGKFPMRFPEREYEMLVNEFDGMGRCLSFAIHSQMGEFEGHAIAVSVAQSFLEVLLTDKDEGEPNPEDARFGRFINGEDMDTIRAEEEDRLAANKPCPSSIITEQMITRRDLLRGAVGVRPE